jgi:hypothetical protein
VIDKVAKEKAWSVVFRRRASVSGANPFDLPNPPRFSVTPTHLTLQVAARLIVVLGANTWDRSDLSRRVTKRLRFQLGRTIPQPCTRCHAKLHCTGPSSGSLFPPPVTFPLPISSFASPLQYCLLIHSPNPLEHHHERHNAQRRACRHPR